MIIEKEENQPKKTSLNLENLVQPLESQIKPYNMWKYLQIIIKGKEEGSSNSKEIKEPISPEKIIIQTIEQVNMANKVKSIIFPKLIKLKTIALKVGAMLDNEACKNLLFETSVPQEDQQTLVQPVELVQYNQQKLILTKYISNVPIIINNITLVFPQTYLVPTITLYPFILGINFVHFLQEGITIPNNQVSFHPQQLFIQT